MTATDVQAAPEEVSESNWRVKPPALRALTLQHFRSIWDQRITFDNPTFFVGRNSSGKSNAVEALALLSEVLRVPLAHAFYRRGGAANILHLHAMEGSEPTMGLAVETGPLKDGVLSARYAFQLSCDADSDIRVVREQCFVRKNDLNAWFDRTDDRFENSRDFRSPPLTTRSLALPVMSAYSDFEPVFRFLTDMIVYRLDPNALKETSRGPDDRLRADGGNAARVLRDMPENYATWFRESLEDFIPALKEVRPARFVDGLALEFIQASPAAPTGSLTFQAPSVSDGALRALGLLLAVFQPRIPSVLVLEEPENTIHTTAFGSLFDLLEFAAERTQVIVTTHSSELLDAEWMRSRHLRVVDWSEGKTRIAPISEAARSAMEDRVMGAGELLSSDFLTAGERFEPAPDPPSLFVDSWP